MAELLRNAVNSTNGELRQAVTNITRMAVRVGLTNSRGRDIALGFNVGESQK